MNGCQSLHANVYATQVRQPITVSMHDTRTDGAKPMAKFSRPDQKHEMLERLISGQIRTCFGVTEPNTGLETLKLRTTATREGDDYLVNGQKMYVELERCWSLVANT